MKRVTMALAVAGLLAAAMTFPGCNGGGAQPVACPAMSGGWLDGQACDSKDICSLESGSFPCHYAACKCSQGTWHCSLDTSCYDMLMPRDLSVPDLGVTAHPGATCNGLACGPNEFCIAAYPGAPLEFGVPTPRCVAVPQCLATPNCDCIAAAACGRADCRIQGDLVNCYLP